MKNILISDPTLRDGNHAIRHQLTAEQIEGYCKLAEEANVPIVEVGHGNGIGASSLLVGKAIISDEIMLKTARSVLKNSKLGVHSIPGFATIEKDLKKAIDLGVDVFRIASHCSEADITENHIQFIRKNNKTAYGVLMMTHMISAINLSEQAFKMQEYGAEAIIIMDSAGNYLPADVTGRIAAIKAKVSIPVGFHGHNNLGMAIANSIAAIEAGATILDGTSRGFGAGAGNTQLEALVAVLKRMGYNTGIDLYKILDASDFVQTHILKAIPISDSVSIISGLSGVFSGFKSHVERIAKEYKIDPKDLFFELGRRKLVAGQEDLIIEAAIELSSQSGLSI
jgi:4-hydroxy 2-oxovalerate aldolase